MRELKLCYESGLPIWRCRTFTGAWIETTWLIWFFNASGRTFTGAWIETNLLNLFCGNFVSHLHGCVNWNIRNIIFNFFFFVAPSRVRELKPFCPIYLSIFMGRTFTGAWIETIALVSTSAGLRSHLHGCVNWNPRYDGDFRIDTSHLHGCVIEYSSYVKFCLLKISHTLS